MHALSPYQLMQMQIGFDGKLAILLLLYRMARPVTSREVAQVFGISEHRAGRHLNQMLDLQWVRLVSPRGGYVLNQNTLVEILAVDPAAALPAQVDDPAPEPDSPQEAGPEAAFNVRIVQLTPATTAFKPEKQNKNKKSAVVAVSRGISARTASRASPPAQWISPPGTPARARLIAALAEQGIGEPKRSQLAGLPHLDADQVSRWAAFLKAERGEKFTTGLLIHVLATGDPAPAARHPRDCRCVECLMGPYLCQDCKNEPCICDELCPDCSQLECDCPDGLVGDRSARWGSG